MCALWVIFSPDDESFKVVSEFYSLDEDSLRSDLKILAHVMKQHFSSNCSIPSIFKHLVTSKAQMMMPEISKALKIYSVIPATSPSAERSFSCLRRLKTYLRSTMLQDRLSNLAIISIEPAFVNKVLTEDMEDMINCFGEKSWRHDLFFLICNML